MLINKTTTPQNKPTEFRELLSDLVCQMDYKAREHLLRELLNSTCGVDNLAGTRAHYDISNALYNVREMLSFFRRLGQLMDDDLIKAIPTAEPILKLYNTLDFDILTDELMSSLEDWIYRYAHEELADLKRVTYLAVLYNDFYCLIHECYEFVNWDGVDRDRKAGSCV